MTHTANTDARSALARIERAMNTVDPQYPYVTCRKDDLRAILSALPQVREGEAPCRHIFGGYSLDDDICTLCGRSQMQIAIAALPQVHEGELPKGGDAEWISNLKPTTDLLETARAALKKIADAPAWGYPERWETTPAEVRQLASETLDLLAAAPKPTTEDAVPEGMKPWHGGDRAPEDWDGGPVLRRALGIVDLPETVTPAFEWRHHPHGRLHDLDIIAYTPKATAPKAAVEAESLASIVAWGDETFGPCEPARAVSRAGEEWREMVSETPGSVQHATEAADVIICLLRIPGIIDAINAKMAKNRKRTWRLMGDGTGYHVRTTDGARP